MAGFVITIAQQKGGAGKTSLSAHLATAFLAMGKKIALLDTDPQGSLSEWFLRRRRSLGDDVGLPLSPVEGWRVQSEANKLKKEYDIIIVDSPPHTDTTAKQAMKASDLVLVPVQPTPPDLWATKPTVKLAEKEKTDILLVLNRVPPRSKLVEEMKERLDMEMWPMAATSLGNRTAFAASLGDGLGVTEYQKKGAAAEEIRALAQEVLKKAAIA